MSFSSINDLITEITAGKTTSFNWVKTSTAVAYAAGRWYDTSGWTGVPRANAWAGTDLTWTTCDETTGNGTQIFGIPHGGNVSTDTKHVISASAFSSVATAALTRFLLVDVQGYWPGINVNTTSPQTLSGTPTLRYANGEGCRLYTVSTVASGATAHNISVTYTNSGGTGSRTLPSTVAMTVSATPSHIAHSGTATNNTVGPFLPLADGDTGVQDVASIELSAASGAAAGRLALVLAKPLLSISLPTASVASETDFVNQYPSLPRIYDGACLVWLARAGGSLAASSPLYGKIDFAWG